VAARPAAWATVPSTGLESLIPKKFRIFRKSSLHPLGPIDPWP
jgi:hypothetical protein